MRGLQPPLVGGGKNQKQVKGGKFAPVDRGVREGDNTPREGQLGKRPEQR